MATYHYCFQFWEGTTKISTSTNLNKSSNTVNHSEAKSYLPNGYEISGYTSGKNATNGINGWTITKEGAWNDCAICKVTVRKKSSGGGSSTYWYCFQFWKGTTHISSSTNLSKNSNKVPHSEAKSYLPDGYEISGYTSGKNTTNGTDSWTIKTEGAWNDCAVCKVTVREKSVSPTYTATITYLPNGAGGTKSHIQVVSGTSTKLSFTALSPDKCGFTTPSGSTFGGWGTSSSSTSSSYTAGSSYPINANASLKLYAIWKYSYKITYYKNDGSNVSKTLPTSSGISSTQSYTIPDPVEDFGWTRTGYYFQGWFNDSTTTTTQYLVGNSYDTSSNKSIYAHWQPNSYTIYFNGNGATSGSMSPMSCYYGSTYELNSNAYKRIYTLTYDKNYTGASSSDISVPCTFLYWSCNNSTYKDGAFVSNLTSTNGGSVTMKAQWEYGSVTLPTLIRSGYEFDGWYTSSSGGNKITNSTTVTASSDNGTLYAHCSYINYNISYNLANGTYGSSHPTSAKYGDVINISKPSKEVTISLSRGTNASDAKISSTSVSAAQTFAGWTATNLNTTTARRGTSSSSVNTQWSSGSTKSTYTYYKNLTATNNATVNLTANWTQKSVTLPTITKSGYACGWATSSTATTYKYESGATYVPNANGSSNLTLYGVCKRIAPPSLTVKFTTSAGYTNTCTSAYTTSHGSCTFDDKYYAPLSLSIVATDTNEVTNMKLEYNKPGQTSYTDITGSYELSFTKSDNTYTAKTSIGSSGKRKLRITATNNKGKTGTVILNINIIPRTFAAQNNCSDKTLTADGNIFVWKGESSCTNASKSPCGQMQKDTLGLISKGAELCYVKTISSSSNVIFIAAWIEESQFSHKGGVLTKGYPGYGTATTKTFNGKTYYYSKLTAWCKNASCGGGWVIKPEI